MRENRLSGSEGGGVADSPYPYPRVCLWCCRSPKCENSRPGPLARNQGRNDKGKGALDEPSLSRTPHHVEGSWNSASRVPAFD
jgi:hypothetical protein